MQFRHVKFFALCTFITQVSTAQAASFNCAAAREASEIRVCANPTLGALDEQLAEVYRDASSRTSDIRSSQRAWLKSRNTCVDDACIQTHYEQRIGELSVAQAPAVSAADAVSDNAQRRPALAPDVTVVAVIPTTPVPIVSSGTAQPASP